MKTTLLALVLALTGLELWAQTPSLPAVNPGRPPRFGAATNAPAGQRRFPTPAVPAPGAAATTSLPNAFGAQAAPAASPAPAEEMIPNGMIDFTSADVNQVLEVYSLLVNRTLLRSAGIPNATIVLKTRTQLTKTEAIQALQAVLALNGIAVVNIGEKFVKVGPVGEANSFGAPFNEASATNLPDVGPYMTHITQLKYVKPSVIIPFIQPFAKLPGGLSPIDDNGILVMRDYAENIKRMLEMIEKIDVSVPAEFISEVIPIRYAEAVDIATALNGLGGSGSGSTVSFGSSASAAPISGVRSSSTGIGGMGSAGGIGGMGTAGGIGGQTRTAGGVAGPNGTPAAAGTTLQSRLQSIINRAASPGGAQDQIQVFGQAKIIADQRANALLVFASRQDMDAITNVIAKLDVLLAQVLIESIILDVGTGVDLNVGVSAQQKAKQFNNSNVAGGGLMNNGNGSFLSVIQNLATNGSSSKSFSIPTNGSGGLSYFGSIGDTWDIAVKAAQDDKYATIIQRPRIQTSQAKPAQFFVGQTVPYVTSTYANSYGSGYGGSSYSQMSVGVELDVTPFINPDGLVVMQIYQAIDELNGTTAISGVGDVPNTIKRTLNTEIAVKNRDTVILGGFVRSGKNYTKSGVPVLMNIPLIGWLFSSREDKNERTELLVMMRPTVLKTPEIAVEQTKIEINRLPGVRRAATENAAEERKMIETERKRELKNTLKGEPADGLFNMKPDSSMNNTPAGDFEAYPATGSSRPAPAGTSMDPAAEAAARAALKQQMQEPVPASGQP